MTIPIEAEVELKAFELWWRDYANAGRHQYHKLLHPDGIAKRIAKDAWDETNARTLPPTADEAFLRKLKSTLNDVNQTDKYSEKMLCVAEARAMVNSRLESIKSSPVSSVVDVTEKDLDQLLKAVRHAGEHTLWPGEIAIAEAIIKRVAASIKPEVASDEEKGQQ